MTLTESGFDGDEIALDGRGEAIDVGRRLSCRLVRLPLLLHQDLLQLQR